MRSKIFLGFLKKSMAFLLATVLIVTSIQTQFVVMAVEDTENYAKVFADREENTQIKGQGEYKTEVIYGNNKDQNPFELYYNRTEDGKDVEPHISIGVFVPSNAVINSSGENSARYYENIGDTTEIDKNSEEIITENSVELTCNITLNKIKQAFLSKKDYILSTWSFDWNNDGTIDQTISTKILLNQFRLYDSHKNILYESVKIRCVATDIDRKPIEGLNVLLNKNGEKISYFPVSPTDKKGESIFYVPYFSDDESHQIVCTLENDNYKSRPQGINVQNLSTSATFNYEDIPEKEETELNISTDIDNLSNVKYKENLSFNVDIDSNRSSSDISFNVSEGAASIEKIADKKYTVTVKGAGNISLTASVPANSEYKKKSIEKSLKIEKGDLDALYFENNTYIIEYNKTGCVIANVKEGVPFEGGKITYTIENSDIASINPDTGELTANKCGQTTVYAHKSYGENYNESVASCSVKVEPAEQHTLSFSYIPNSTVNCHSKITNPVVANGCVDLENNVTYSSSDSNIATVDKNGTVYFLQKGTVTITATLTDPNGNYRTISAEYTVQVNVIAQPDKLVFNNPVESYTIKYGNTFTNAVEGGTGSGKIKYSSNDESVAKVNDNGVVTSLKSGTAIITATKEGDSIYDAQSVSYTINIEKADCELEFKKSQVILAYNSTNNKYSDNIVKKIGDCSCGKSITYSSNNIDIATVDSSGIVTMNRSGNVEITAEYPGCDHYNSKSVSYDLTINKSNLTLEFMDSAPEITYDANETHYINNLTIDELSDAVTEYSSSDSDVAFVNANGQVTINKAGTTVITVTVRGDNQKYNDTSKSYTLTIKKADQQLSFPLSYIDVFYGTKTRSVQEIQYPEHFSTGELTYSIISGEDIASINPTTGVLTFNSEKYGTVTVAATKEGDERYNSQTISYNIYVKFYQFKEKKYDISDDKGNVNKGDDEWYTGSISIKAKEGFLLSNSFEFDTVWTTELNDVLPNDVKEGKVEFFVKNEDGYISNVNTVIMNKDTVNPASQIKIEETKNFWTELCESLTFGLWYNSKREFRIYGYDATSGIKSIEYIVDKNPQKLFTKNELDCIEDWTKTEQLEELSNSEYQCFVSLSESPNEKIVIYAKVTDNAGRITYVSTDGIILDDISPVPSIDVEDNALFGISDLVDGKVKIKASITDQSPSSGIESASYTVEANQISKIYSINIPKKENELVTSIEDFLYIDTEIFNCDNIQITLNVKDNAGNHNSCKKTINIDATRPVVSFEFTDGLLPVNEKDNRNYYNSYRKATITIKERNSHFSESTASRGISVLDSDGNPIDFENITWGTDNEAGDSCNHTAIIVFKDNNYSSISVTYTDAAGNKCESDYNNTSLFTVDTEDPSGEITVNENKWSNLIKILTFGIFTVKSEISFEYSDTTSPIYSADYYIDLSNAIKSKDDLENISDWQNASNFSLDEDDSYVVYFRVVDYAGNTTYISSNGFIVDKTSPEIITTYESSNENGFYNDDVYIDAVIKDAESGIKSISYTIERDGKITQKGDLYTFTNENPSYSELKKELSSQNGDFEHIKVDAKENNSDNVVVKIISIDNSGNPSQRVIPLRINTTPPRIELSYDNNSVSKIENNRGYFKNTRTSTITIIDRNSSFDSVAATNGIKITALDINGKTVELPENMISDWDTVEGSTPDEAKHIATVTYNTDANYTFEISYKNKANNENEIVILENSTVTPYEFTVDTKKPTGVVKVDNLGTWDKLVEVLTFGLYTKKSVDVTAECTDTTSPIESVKYYKTSDTNIPDLSALDENQWTEYQKFSVSSDERFTVYFKITDYANNVLYISSNGIIFDDESAKVALDPEKPNKNGFYNNDVKVRYTVKEQEPHSGIKTINWVVKCDGVVTQEETLDFSTKNPTYQQLLGYYNGEITVDAKKNNSDNVTVTVTSLDNAGNRDYRTANLKIDITKPVIEVKYDNNNVNKMLNGRGYFNSSRKATITIKERASGFDSDIATQNINITAKDINGKTVELNKNMISSWKTTAGSTPDSTKHIATIIYDKDANYTFSISYTDKAGNKNNGINTSESVSPYKFTVDTKKPFGSIQAGSLGTWNKLINNLTFGLWTNSSVDVSAEYHDVTSPIKSVKYYKTSNTKALSRSDLNKISDANWVSYKPFSLSSNEYLVIYLKIEDYAGNIEYISSNGIIYDDEVPVFEKISPEITVTQREGFEIANTDVILDIDVKDPAISNTYSGLNKINYTVSNMGQVTQKGELYHFDLTDPKYSELKQSWNGNITVNSNLNNSNDIKVIITASDNAGNTSSKSYNLKIDTTRPDININYNNNSALTGADGTVYFDQSRTATVTITERNFDPERVKIDIKNSDGSIPSISSWITNAGTGNGDNTTHTATITYSDDGSYIFSISYDDMAGNKNTDVTYGNSVSPEKFVVDRTTPQLSINYNNNSNQNGMYYNADRTLTVTITEHNFNSEDVNIRITASDNGKAISIPKIQNWTSNGDTHTATINFNTDAHYTLDISYKDLAGNSIGTFNRQQFVIDKVKPTVEVDNIIDNSANKEDIIGFVITSTDTNFDIFDVHIKRIDVGGNNDELNIGTFENINNGKKYTVNNIEADGIYEILLRIVDKAGNICDSATLFNSNGEKYKKDYKDNAGLMSFSVNRSGSTFMIDNDLKQVVDNYYINSIDDDIVITETNADEITQSVIYVNDTELKANVDYSIEHIGGNGEWNRYLYKIDKSFFENEGEYTIKIKTTDKAGNVAYNDMKGVDMRFVIDKSSPTITISGLNANGSNRFMEESHTVTVIPKDDGGNLKSVLVYIYNSNGNIIDSNGNITDSAAINLSGDKLINAMESNNGQLTFTLPSAIDMHISIECTDTAGNEPYKADIYGITVSTSFIIIFYSNKPLFYGSIVGLLLIITAIITFIVLRRKRKKSSKNA